MKTICLFFALLLVLTSLNAQEVEVDSIFTTKEHTSLHKLDIQNLANYSFDNTQINTYLRDVLVLDKKRVNNNTAGYILLGVGVLSAILGEAAVQDTQNNQNSSGDIVGDILSSSISSGVNEVGKGFRTFGFVLSAGSIPFFINAKSKKNKRNQRIGEVDKLF